MGAALLPGLPFAQESPAASQPDLRLLVRVECRSRLQWEALVAGGLDVWEAQRTDEGGRALIFASPEQRSRLTAEGFEWTVDEARQNELEAAAAAERRRLARRAAEQAAAPPAPTAPARAAGTAALDYFTLAEYEAAMQNWAAAFPDRVLLWSLGKSHENRDVWMMRVSARAAQDEDEPEVLLIALQHAREWLSGMTLWGIARWFIEQYGTDARATDILDSTELYFVLVCNPDGYQYTHTTDRYWRKNRRNNGSSYGVDLNRNFPYQWNFGDSNPASNTYRGPAPLSEPENAALVNWITGRGTALKGILNYHTYGTRVMHNWAWTYALPPNVDVMGPLARDVALAIEAVNGRRMRNGSWAVTLAYTGGGSTIDYCHAELGVPTLTLELRPGDGQSGDFVVDPSHIEPSISENIEGAVTFIQWARAQAADPTSPVLTNLAVSGISSTQATLTWTTDDPADRAVEFGTSTALGLTAQPDRLRGRSHNVTVTGLTPDTQYFARARSTNLAGLTGFSNLTSFRTAAVPQDLTPPGAPELTLLRRSTDGSIALQWLAPGDADLAGFRLYESTGGSTWTLRLNEALLPGGTTSVSFPPPALNTTLLYRLVAVDDAPTPNESAPSRTWAVRVGGGPAPVLIVDGYDRWASKNEAIGLGKGHAFAADHGAAVGAFGSAFDTCANELAGGAVALDDYQVVIWVLGDESSGTEAFSSAEQALVAAFLQNGGNLFVSGSDVAWDLDRPTGPTGADRDFLNTYLCADFVRDDMDAYDSRGTGGAGVFGDRLVRFDDGSRGIYRVQTPDVVTPVNGGSAALKREGGSEVCAVQKAGTFGGGSVPGKMIYLCFPFETIFDASEREAVMADALTWFGLSPGSPSGVSLFYLY
ncbi:MAG: hypothetical protein Kow0059_15720 [Candidatus Sumerlaeia bacterium]